MPFFQSSTSSLTMLFSDWRQITLFDIAFCFRFQLVYSISSDSNLSPSSWSIANIPSSTGPCSFRSHLSIRDRGDRTLADSRVLVLPLRTCVVSWVVCRPKCSKRVCSTCACKVVSPIVDKSSIEHYIRWVNMKASSGASQPTSVSFSTCTPMLEREDDTMPKKFKCP